MNLDKCEAIINMRSLSRVKEVKQLIGSWVAMVCFLSSAGEKAFHFFSIVKKKEKFIRTSECEESFSNLKTFLTTLPILTCSIVGMPLYHIFVTDQSVSFVLFLEKDKVEQLVYFVKDIL